MHIGTFELVHTDYTTHSPCTYSYMCAHAYVYVCTSLRICGHEASSICPEDLCLFWRGKAVFPTASKDWIRTLGVSSPALFSKVFSASFCLGGGDRLQPQEGESRKAAWCNFKWVLEDPCGLNSFWNQLFLRPVPVLRNQDPSRQLCDSQASQGLFPQRVPIGARD